LTELAVAMVVVGILASIAVPSFLGARNSAFDREAQAAVDAALNAASIHYANNGDFSDTISTTCGGSEQLTEDLQRMDPNYDFITGATASDNPRKISIQAAETFNDADDNLGCQAIYAVVLSRSGTCWVGRLTVEGSFLGAEKASPIEVNTGTENAPNETITEVDSLQLNGKAYAGLIPTSSSSKGSGGESIDAISDDCSANAQDIGADSASVSTDDYFDSWRTVTLVLEVE
jgi:type II secretory pathway pseudopilin PulG